ncbi:MAG: TonB-dependent receptor [Psychromonas sp.]
MKLNKISSVFNVNKYSKTNLAIFGATLTAMLAMPTYAAEAEAAEAAETAAPVAIESREDIEVIQVTGMLGSMKAAAILKRSDGRIVDAIVAEDIGKLPDNNIAEALQRITGVSINTDFGVGDSVSIRGLSQNRVELNGRSTIGDSRGGVSLQDFPSSFLKTVEVVKSPTADMIEGALGGTVSMFTVRPLELDGLTGAVSLDAEYADKTENVAPIFSGSIGDNWDFGSNGTFGAIMMLSYQDREIRQDEYTSRIYPQAIDAGGAGGLGDGNTVSGNYMLADQFTYDSYTEKRERTAVNLSLQWAPESGDGMVYLDMNITDRSGEQHGNSILAIGGVLSADANTTQSSSGRLNNYTLTNEFAIPKTYADFRDTDSYSHAIGGEWNLTENILIKGEISIASSDSYRPDNEMTLRPIDREIYNNSGGDLVNNTFDTTFYQSGDKLPSIQYSDPTALTDPGNLALRTFKAVEMMTLNDELAARLDVELYEPIAAASNWLTTVKAGVRFTQREYNYKEYLKQVADMYKNAYVADADGNATDERATMWLDDYNELFPGSFTVVTPKNAFDQMGKSGPNDMLTFATFNGLENTAQAYANVMQSLKGTNLYEDNTLAEALEHQDSAYRDIVEDTAAIYVSAYLEFDRLTAIVGGRYVMTDLESSVLRDGELVVGDNDYGDFLPSLNMTYNITDDTLIRFAAAKVMRRANFSELSPAFDPDNDIIAATQGAVDLDPYRATQFDISAEHYFGDGNMVSFALFYKDVESFLSTELSCVASELTAISNVVEWEQVCLLDNAGVSQDSMIYGRASDYATNDAGLVATEAFRDDGLTGIATSKSANGENGTVQGFELGYQQHFAFLPGAFSGLGLSVNYTYSDSEQPNGSPLLEISEHTANVQGFWEYEGLAFRLAYNYRSDFLESEDEKRVIAVNENGGFAGNADTIYGNNYRDDRGQLDASASWDINEHFTLVANATNITGEASVYMDELGEGYAYFEADRRYSIGIRAKF